MAEVIIKCDPSRVIKGLDALKPKFVRELLRLTRKHLELGVDILKTRHMSGRSAVSVAEVTRKLKKSVEIIKPTVTTTKITGGIKIGGEAVPYAKIHVGRRGKESILFPRTSKMLAVPTKFARTAKGVPRGKPLDPIWGITFIANNMIFGYKRGVKREYAKPVPLFILKKSVTVKTRIDPKEDVRKVILPGLRIDLKKMVSTIVGGAR